MKKNYLFYLVLSYQLIVNSFSGYAQQPANSEPGNIKDPAIKADVVQLMQKNAGLNFEENKGQMLNMDNKVDKDLLFKANAGGVDIYITTTGLSYVFINKIHTARKVRNMNPLLDEDPRAADYKDSVTLNYCRCDLELVGADIRKENIIKEYESHSRTDYYLGNLVTLNVHTYQQITIKNIYPGIDWVLYTAAGARAAGKTGGMQYDFVVHPGGDPAAIKLKCKCKAELQSDGSLKISTQMGGIVQGMPVSYMYGPEYLNAVDWNAPIVKGTPTSSPDTRYVIKDNEISFKIDSSYNKKGTLIIDPATVTWGTYAGAGDIFSMWDDGSHVFLTGGGGSSGFPTDATGSQYSGGSGNVIIYEFTDATGTQEWATVYGGAAASGDYAESIMSDGKDVWVTGFTYSTSFHIQTLTGAYNQTALKGSNSNPFILKFNTAGAIQWATYFDGVPSYPASEGTSGLQDAGYGISSDGTNMWVTGTSSSSNFPCLNDGANFYQTALAGTAIQAFVAQFNASTCAQIYSTLIGGTGLGDVGDRGNSVMTDGTHAWVTGRALSSNFPTQSLATATFNYSGGGAFILEFNDNNSDLVWSSNLASSSSSDQGLSIYSDNTHVWVTGRSSGGIATMASGAQYTQTDNASGTYTAFIDEFQASTSAQIWGTFYGGTGANGYGDEGQSIVSDGTDVYITGYTGSTNFPQMNTSTCAGSYDQATFLGSGNQNIFLGEFTIATGAMVWSTYYGEEGYGSADGDGAYVFSDGKYLFMGGDVNYGATGNDANDAMPLVDLGGSYYNTTKSEGNEWTFIDRLSLCTIVTPITLLYFNCAPASNGIGFDLTWATASEQNNKYFTIERSSDGVNFYSIATVPGAGNSVFTKTYEYTDINPLSGLNYYRLSQTDNFGNTVQDNISACDEEDSVLVYPNPASGVFAIKLPTKDVSSPTTIALYDLLGQRILSQTVQNQPIINISIPSVAASIYLVRITTAEKTYTIKLVIKK